MLGSFVVMLRFADGSGTENLGVGLNVPYFSSSSPILPFHEISSSTRTRPKDPTSMPFLQNV